jgi:hypothetical protein
MKETFAVIVSTIARCRPAEEPGDQTATALDWPAEREQVGF